MALGGERIAIAGAGLAGALLASMLAELGYEVTVYERRPDPRLHGFAGGRSINLALSLRGIHALEQAGLADRVLAEAIPMPGRMIHSPTGSLTFQPYSKNRDEAINSVSRGGLNVTLLESAAARANVRHLFEHRCVEVDLDAPALLIARGDGSKLKRFETDVVIGCDGAFSAVRGQMQKLDRFDYIQSYLEHGYKELTIPPTEAGEFAMDPHALHIWPRGGFMMIALPNRDRSFTCTCFWPFSGPHGFESVRTPDEIKAFFETHFPDAVPLMPSLVEDYERNPTSSLVTVRCAPWHHGGKVVLVGDAAHAIVPFYGQGMNAAFEDCVLLVDCIRDAGGDFEQAFDRYFAARRADADAIADLALANFVEMRDHVASPAFRMKKRVERVLHRLLPGYTPLYNMVSFTRIPYAEARARARRTDRGIRRVAALAAFLLLLLAAGAIWRLVT